MLVATTRARKRHAKRVATGRKSKAEIRYLRAMYFPEPGCRLRVVVDNAKDVSASLVRTDETMSNALPDRRIHETTSSRGTQAWLKRRRDLWAWAFETTGRGRGNLGEGVTCGCVLESTPAWFLVETVECSCGTRPTNFPSHPDVVRYSFRRWRRGDDASLARPAVGNTWVPLLPRGARLRCRSLEGMKSLTGGFGEEGGKAGWMAWRGNAVLC